MPVHRLDRVHRPAFGTVAVSRVLEVSFEDGLQHNLGRGLDHAVTKGWDTELRARLRHLALESSRAAPDRAGMSSKPVPRASPSATPPGPVPQLARKSSHPRPGLPHWRGRAGRRAARYRRGKSCRRAHRSGRRAPPSPCNELYLKAPDLIGCFKAHRQSPSPLPSSKARQESGSFAPPALPGFIARTTLSDSRRNRCLTQR